jgi:hypothetical protein
MRPANRGRYALKHGELLKRKVEDFDLEIETSEMFGDAIDLVWLYH